MSSFNAYLLGFLVLTVGVAIGAYLLGIALTWIGVGVLVLIGLGIMSAVTKARRRDVPKSPPQS